MRALNPNLNLDLISRRRPAVRHAAGYGGVRPAVRALNPNVNLLKNDSTSVTVGGSWWPACCLIISLRLQACASCSLTFHTLDAALQRRRHPVPHICAGGIGCPGRRAAPGWGRA